MCAYECAQHIDMGTRLNVKLEWAKETGHILIGNENKNKTIDRLLISIQYQSSSSCDALRYNVLSYVCSFMHLALDFVCVCVCFLFVQRRQQQWQRWWLQIESFKHAKSILIGISIYSYLPENKMCLYLPHKHTLPIFFCCLVGKRSALHDENRTFSFFSFSGRFFLLLFHVYSHFSCDKSPKQDHTAKDYCFENTCHSIVWWYGFLSLVFSLCLLLLLYFFLGGGL